MTEPGGKFSYKDWYQKNKKRLSEKRKKKYNEDPEYRARQLAQAKFHYWTTRRYVESIASEVVLKSEVSVRVRIDNVEDARYGKVIEVPAYKNTDLAKVVSRSKETLYAWERRGIVPKAMDWGTIVKLWTEDQVLLFLECRHLLDIPSEDFDNSLFKKEIWEGWEQMPDGVRVIPINDVRAYCPTCSFEDTMAMPDGKPLLCPSCGTRMKLREAK